jgi:hypothetical protein
MSSKIGVKLKIVVRTTTVTRVMIIIYCTVILFMFISVLYTSSSYVIVSHHIILFKMIYTKNEHKNKCELKMVRTTLPQHVFNVVKVRIASVIVIWRTEKQNKGLYIFETNVSIGYPAVLLRTLCVHFYLLLNIGTDIAIPMKNVKECTVVVSDLD